MSTFTPFPYRIYSSTMSLFPQLFIMLIDFSQSFKGSTCITDCVNGLNFFSSKGPMRALKSTQLTRGGGQLVVSALVLSISRRNFL